MCDFETIIYQPNKQFIMKTKTSIYRFSKHIFYLLLALVLFSCSTTGVKQELIDGYLYTSGKYKGNQIYREYDRITISTPDSIKKIRYKEAQEMIDKYKRIDSFN